MCGVCTRDVCGVDARGSGYRGGGGLVVGCASGVDGRVGTGVAFVWWQEKSPGVAVTWRRVRGGGWVAEGGGGSWGQPAS